MRTLIHLAETVRMITAEGEKYPVPSIPIRDIIAVTHAPGAAVTHASEDVVKDASEEVEAGAGEIPTIITRDALP